MLWCSVINKCFEGCGNINLWWFFAGGGGGGLRVLREVFLPLFVSIVSLFVAESDSRGVFVALRV